MKTLARICRFRKNQDGATAIEYGLIAALIAVVKLSENRNNAELPTCKKPNSKISLKCALMMLNLKKSSRHTNGRKISVARTQRQNDKPKAGISS